MLSQKGTGDERTSNPLFSAASFTVAGLLIAAAGSAFTRSALTVGRQCSLAQHAPCGNMLQISFTEHGSIAGSAAAGAGQDKKMPIAKEAPIFEVLQSGSAGHATAIALLSMRSVTSKSSRELPDHPWRLGLTGRGTRTCFALTALASWISRSQPEHKFALSAAQNTTAVPRAQTSQAVMLSRMGSLSTTDAGEREGTAGRHASRDHCQCTKSSAQPVIGRLSLDRPFFLTVNPGHVTPHG